MSGGEKRGLRPGDVIAGRWKIGGVIGLAADPDSECDAPDGGSYMMADGKMRCRCVVCPRCHHHTGNSHQGHYWAMCKVTGTTRDFHLCCPDPAYGCELEAMTDMQAAIDAGVAAVMASRNLHSEGSQDWAARIVTVAFEAAAPHLLRIHAEHDAKVVAVERERCAQLAESVDAAWLEKEPNSRRPTRTSAVHSFADLLREQP